LLAIDSSALGGMYAGAIRLVGTEAGVGVKLAADMAASGGDINIDANGKLTVARVASAGSVHANAKQIELTDTLYASNTAGFTAEQIDIASSLASGANLTLNGAVINNNGSIEAGVKTDGSGNSAALLDLQGGTLNNNGSISSQGSLNTDLQQLNNSGKKVLAVGNATVKASTVDNRSGQIVAQQTLSVTADTLDNRAGTIASNKALSLTLTDTLNNSADGLLLSKADGLTVNAQTLNNAGGTAQADASELKIISSTTVNSAGTLQGESVNLRATGTLINDGGRIAATQGQATLTGGAISNNAGSVLAKTTVKATASSLNNAGGTLGANSVDLDVSGHLSNDSGLIESTTTLLLKAGSLSNGSGKLRALASTGSSVFEIGGLFNNDGGLVEIGNSQLSLTSASLSNQSGKVRHLGNQFALALADVGNAGGSFITNGELNLNVAEWTNSSQLQAQKISLNVGTFTQTASGKLLSKESITATGDTWQNDGSIETDGALKLTLTGAYSGNGALLSQGDLTVTAASVDTGVDAQWKTGGKADVTVGGELINRGKISAAQNLIARANSLNNYGTLGAATTLRVEANSLRNDGGLIFSGADMALRTDSFTNLRADVYSLGTLSIAKNDANAQLSLLENRSGSIESAGDMSLRAAVFSNRKELFRTEKTQTYGHVNVVCYDCSGDHHNVDYIATEIFRTTVAEDSAAARISSGANLDIQGGALSNQYSTLAATGAVTITGTSLENLGASTGTVQRVRTFNTGRVTDGTEERFRENYVDPYNAQGFPKTLSSNFSRWNLLSDIETDTPTGIAAPAIIQAGGNVTIQATQPITNASVMANQAPQLGTAQNLDTTVKSGTQTLVVQLNPQLPPDAAQQGVNPITLPSFSLPQGQNGLFHVNTDNSHPYLVESNPAFASLRNFISSDYLLGIIGYNAGLTQRRLGDGLYEQRLVQDAIVARTGKRFLDGLASDEAQFKYLMDNAIASKTALNLVPGIALSAEQVAALTHDIVWMQEQEVNGQKVLVPVLYLAQATDRLAPTGALIQGRDVALISGSDLTNSGILRASNTLTVNAANINNSGLAQANERLSMLATDSIRNTAGGILKGKDVSITAVAGDVINQRNIATDSRSGKNFSTLTSVVDNAARIEAGNDLVVSAGRDIQNTGGAISAGKNADLSAGRNLVIAAAEAENGQMRKDRRHFWETTSTTQYGSDVKVGTDLTAKAGNDLTVVASTVKATGDIALQAGKDVTIASAANDASSEYHYKGNGKKIDKENRTVRQQASVIEAGGDLDIAANNDLTVSSSQLQAGNEAYLYAKGDIQLEAAQNEDYSYSYKMKKSSGLFGSKKKSSMSESSNNQAVSSTITAGSDLTLVANNDITSRGAELSSDKAVALYAGHDIVLDAAENSASQAGAKSKSSLFSSKSSNKSSSNTSLTSTRVNGESVELLADNDITLRAAAVYADKSITLDAGRDVAISTAQQSQQSSQASKSNKLNWHLTDSLATNGSFTLENKGKGAEQKTVQEVGSTLSGGSIDVSSGRDTTVRASTLVADDDIRVDAGRNLSVVSGESISTSIAKSKSKNAGEIGNWYQGATGVASLKETNQNSATTQTGSQIASLGGDVQLQAGERYKQIASQVVAPSGDISIIGKQVDIEAGYDILSSTQKQSSSRTALGGSVSIPIVDAVRSIKNMGEAAQSTGDTRLKALAAVNIAMDAQRAYDAATALGTDSLTGLKISVNLSNDKGSSSRTQSGQNVVASTVAAGGNVNITASGAGKDSDLTVVGSEISAGKDATLKADGDINLLAAQNTAEQHSKNAGSGWSVGVGFALFGEQNGFTIDLAANKSRGNADGSDVAWTQTTIQAGNYLGFWSGEDTNLKGAIARGDQVVANVGGDLNIESVQDTSTYKSKQTNASVGVSLCIPPFCYGAPVGSGSASFGQQKIDSEYASVTQQSGIKAGDKGFDITVGGNTDLKGAVIASTDKAVTDGKNSLTTGSLTHSDIKNKAEYDATSISLSGGYTGETHDANGNVIKTADGKPKYESGATATTPIVLSASDDAKSTTHSGISVGTITITDAEKQKQLTNQTTDEAVASIDRDVSSDKDGSNALKPIFDRKEIEAGFEITEAFVRNVGTFLEQRAYESADAKRKLEAEKAKPESERNQAVINQLQYTVDANKTWEMGGVGRTLVSALSGAAGANVTGGGSQLLQGAAVNYLQSLAAEQVKRIAEDLDSETARTALHAVVGCAGAAAQNRSCSAGAIGASASVILNNLLDKLKDETASGMTDSEKQNRLNLIGTLVAGITAAAGGEAAVAANAAQIEAANNHLREDERLYLIKVREEYAQGCGGEAAKTDSCESKKKTLDVLEEKAKSIAASYGGDLAEDMSIVAGTVETKPGDVVRCEISTTGYCVVTDQSTTTINGKEWLLTPANEKVASAAQDENNAKLAAMNETLRAKGIELYDAGCSAMVLCLAYKATGGENIITNEVATRDERILALIQLAATGAGVVGIVKLRNFTVNDFPLVSNTISRQKQLRHLEGTPELAGRGAGGYLSDAADAQKVLDAYLSGKAVILGKNAQGFPVVKYNGVTGINVNNGAGISAQPTNVFIIKGTKSPSVVPTSPTPKLVK
jgi:filamentous hemagglutinin